MDDDIEEDSHALENITSFMNSENLTNSTDDMITDTIRNGKVSSLPMTEFKGINKDNISREESDFSKPQSQIVLPQPQSTENELKDFLTADSNSFETTLAQFLNNTQDEPEEVSQDEPKHIIKSVYDLLSVETRDYLSKHCNGSGRTRLQEQKDSRKFERENITSKSVRIHEDTDITHGNDVISNYMRTMQHYIGRSSFKEKKTASISSTQKSFNSFDSGKLTSLNGNYGYESIDGIGKNLDGSVRRWLIGLRLPNLPKYLKIFEKNEIDGDSIKLMSEGQLRSMGINSYGPLNKMLHSIRVMRNFDPPRFPVTQIKRTDEKKECHSTMSSKSVAERLQNNRKQRSSSAPGTPRKHNSKNTHKKRSIPSEENPIKEKCLLRLLVKEDEKKIQISQNIQGECDKGEPVCSARSHVSDVMLIKKAERDIGKAAKKFQSKIDKDMQKKEAEERHERMLHDKRLRFAADYHRRQETKKVCQSARTTRDEKENERKTCRKSKRTPRSARESNRPEVFTDKNRSNENRRKDIVLDDLGCNIETQMAIDNAKPSLVFEDQLDDLEFQIQNLADIQTLKQTDSQSLLSCIDQLQKQLHHIQSMVSQQRSPTGNLNEEKKKAVENYQRKSSTAPRSETSQTELRFSERDFIGEGVFSQTFRGKYKNREVAIKRLKIPLTTDDKMRLSQEINFLMELKHENICSFLGCNIRMKFPLLIQKFCNGGSLRQLLLKMEPLDHSAFYQIAEDVCSGLMYLHTESPLSPRSHLRLTSHNILLDLQLRARLSDIGLSRLRHECSRAIRQTGGGRSEWSQLPWMAPEVLAGEEAGQSADLYSFGVVLWEMLMRQVPYNGLTTFQMMERIRDGPPLTVPDSCPVSLRGLIRRCWQLRPSDRTTVQEALLSLSRQKFPASWETVLQSAGVSTTMRSDVYTCRKIIAQLLNLSPPFQPQRGQMLPPNGPCGLLSFPLPDLELSPISRIEEFAMKITNLEESNDAELAGITSPLSAELTARGAVWANKRGGRLHDQ